MPSVYLGRTLKTGKVRGIEFNPARKYANWALVAKCTVHCTCTPQDVVEYSEATINLANLPCFAMK